MLRSLYAACLAFAVTATGAFGQTALSTSSVNGTVVDQANGLPVSGARIESIGATQKLAVTDSNGHFTLSGLSPGLYQLRITNKGYQTTLSDNVALVSGGNVVVTMDLARQKTGESDLRTIARTSTRASEALQRSSVISQSVSADTMQGLGDFRAGDYLVTLPQINMATGTTGGSDTPSPGDDQYIDIRGIGNLETTTLLDGNPIGAGLNRGHNFGYNWESSPTFALSNIVVTYGSGLSGLTPYSALGGVADMRTIDPTPDREFSFTQGYGSFSKLVTTFSATGQLDPHWGYALAAGTQGIDGPYAHDSFYQPAAAFDQAAPVGSAVYKLGIYPYDTSVVNRGALAKFRYTFGDPQRPSHITTSAVWSAYWDNKTGNGDQDFLPYNTALALGNSLLASYTPPAPTTPPYSLTNLPACGAGTFLGTSLNGNPYGFGPNGQPDGGPSCVTPKQYAQFASGWQGAGTTWQAFHQAQYNVRFDTPTPSGQVVVDTYTNTWFQLYDRTYELPWNVAQPIGPGYGLDPFTTSPAVSTTGVRGTDEFFGPQDDFGAGVAYNNYAYSLQTLGLPPSDPIASDISYYLQNVWHPENAKYKAYFNAAEVYSSITNSFAFNPRLALIYDLSRNDTLRLAAGRADTQPYASQVFTPASLVAPGALPGNINCPGLTIIGDVGNPTLGPEKADDVDLSYGHRFTGDSQIQASAYSENVSDKIFPEPINVNTLPAGFINTAPYTPIVQSQCGTAPGAGALGVNSQTNIGRLLAQGIDVQGRERLNRRLFFDYDYSIETSVLKSADTLLLENNPTYIIGAQLPGVPAHKWQIGADQTFGRNVDVRYTQYYVAVNNPKNMPAYNYGELSASVPYGSGRFNLSIFNLFNQFVQWNGLIGNGVPLALNQYATASDYAPYIGAGATEEYGLPSRQIYFSYTFQVKGNRL